MDSLTKQGFSAGRHEVIIVNDGSTDSSETIIDGYCAKYNYMRKINIPNGGVSGARNTGINAAKGKYLAFIDSDDLVAANCYVPIVTIMEKEGFKGLYFNSTSSLDNLESFTNEYVRKDRRCTMSVWRNIYLRDTIVDNAISFDSRVSFNEDFLFNYKYSMLSGSGIGYIGRKLYYYRPNPNSATHAYLKHTKRIAGKGYLSDTTDIASGYLFRYYTSLKTVCLEIKSFTDQHGLPHDDFYNECLAAPLSSLLWGTMISGISPFEVIEDLKNSGIQLKELKAKRFEGDSIKYRFKSELQYRFRNPIIYVISCWLYRIISFVVKTD